MISGTFPVTIRLRAPFLTKSSTSTAYGLDAPMASSMGRYILSGNHVKGLLRESWQLLQSAAPGAVPSEWPSWLGSPAGNRATPGDYAPKRGRLHFEDFHGPETIPGAASRARIRMDPETRSAAAGMLQFIESPFPSGELVEFNGNIRAFLPDATASLPIERFLQAGLDYLSHFGAYGSIGFGRPGAINVHPFKLSEATPLVWDVDSGAVPLTLTFHRPVCIPAQRLADNVFESALAIPGAALRGAIGELGRAIPSAFPALQANLHLLRFTHAFPASLGAARPVVPPLSLVQVSSRPREFFDVAFQPRPALIDGAAPEFAIDWKSRDFVDTHFGWPGVPRELRVRTSIDSGAGRAAEGQLFAYLSLVPTDLHWRCTLDLSRLRNVPERATVVAELQQLLAHGLPGIGKTKAFAAVAVSSSGQCVPPPPINDAYVVTLQTPSLLLHPDSLGQSGAVAAGSSDGLHRAYDAAFTELSGGALALSNCFQSLTLAGGNNLRHRFQKDRPYRPYLLTAAGSVFVLRPNNGNAEEVVSGWRNSGLPVPPGVLEFYAPGIRPDVLWDHCPYIPENGYGEVAVNLPVHQTLQNGGRHV